MDNTNFKSVSSLENAYVSFSNYYHLLVSAMAGPIVEWHSSTRVWGSSIAAPLEVSVFGVVPLLLILVITTFSHCGGA